jgi:uncharacterized coiled-coil DUF342 family protein
MKLKTTESQKEHLISTNGDVPYPYFTMAEYARDLNHDLETVVNRIGQLEAERDALAKEAAKLKETTLNADAALNQLARKVADSVKAVKAGGEWDLYDLDDKEAFRQYQALKAQQEGR